MKSKFIVFFVLVFVCRFAGYAQFPVRKIKVSDDIELMQLSEKAYVHVSVAEIEGFGKVASNGLVLLDKGEVFLFDSPVTNDQTEVLCNWLSDSLQAAVSVFVPNHWHNDCMGGLEYLHGQGVKSWANQMTVDLAQEKGLSVPQRGFADSLSLYLQDTRIVCRYLGGAHSTDNIVVWIPSEKILFAGCMVKDIDSGGLGNLSDADVGAWPHTLEKILEEFPEAAIVIPGHGPVGGKELLTHTQKLLLRKS